MHLIHKLLLAVGLFAAAASGQTVISVLQGNGQLVPANLGQPSKLIVFQVTTNGVPAAGVTININNSIGLTFSPLSSSTLVTDNNGQASTYFLPGTLTTSNDFTTYFFTATTSTGASASFVETAYYVSLSLQPGASVYRIGPDPSLLTPLTGTAGAPTVPFTLQALATAGSQSGQPIPNVGVHIVLNQNPAPPGTPMQSAYCAEGQGPERIVFTNASGFATCTPVFALPNASLTPGIDDFTFTVSAGDFNSFGPFNYNIAPAPLVLSSPGTRVLLTGAPFSTTLSASGGIAPYTFSLAPGSGPLPPGISVSSTGVVSGTASTPRLYNVTLQVVDKLGTVTTTNATFAVSGGPLQVVAPASTVITAGTGFDLTFRISGGVPPYNLSLVTALPSGVTLTKSDDVGDTYELKGTFPTPGTFSFGVVATDVVGSVSPPATVTITAVTPLVFNATTLPFGTVGQPLSAILNASGGQGPYTFTLAPGSKPLPGGLSLSSSGILSGTPTTPGLYNFTVQVRDNLNSTVSAGVTLAVSGGTLQVTAPASTTIAPGGSVDLFFHATGGVPPYTLTLTGATLPPGVTFLATSATDDTYELKGVFPASGTYNLAVVASDAIGRSSAGAPVTILVSSPLTFASSVLTPVVTGTPFKLTLTANGGVPPYSFKFAGTPPDGLSLSPAGVLTGNLALPGTRVFTVDVADSNGSTASAQLQLPVAVPAPLVVAVTNGASFLPGPIAPGEVVTIFGTNLGPATPAGLTLDAAGNVSTSLGGVQVLIDGIPAPLLYVSSTQINAVVPFGAIHPNATLTVLYQGQQSVSVPVIIRAAEPGIFVIGGTQAAVVNQDHTLNGPDHPAPRGSVIAIYATGAGQTTPAMVDGQVPTAASTANIAGLTVTVGGQPATVAYAGAAPGLIAGVVQINVTVPATAPAGSAVPITISVGTPDNVSQTATIAVQ